MTDLINWLWQAIVNVWDSFAAFLTDLPILILEGVLNGLAVIIELIPSPDFISGGLQSLFNAVDPSVLYFLQRSGLAPALGLIGAGYAFRLLRKVVTLFQW